MNADLILWRHAEAEDLIDNEDAGGNDLSRRLTPKGEKQAARMAAWLQHRLPEDTRVWSSPAVRTEQTVLALGRKYRLSDQLRPEAGPDDLLELLQWPQLRHPALIVGHQPTLGRVVASLLGLSEADCSVRKGAVWWLRQRVREDHPHIQVLAVMSPDWS